ncbi:MAG: zf-TFIIB domain-containing protein [Phycisphaerales bacterium]|nr:zf-TFIIB domain-containing protein [Phycisphaerales bacterium]
MHCPVDGKPLTPMTYEGVTVHTCTTCGGECLPGDQLAHIVSVREARFDAATVEALSSFTPLAGVPADSGARALHCPACECAMRVVNYSNDSGVIIDRCPACSCVWLDKDELEHLQILMEMWHDRAPAGVRDVAAQLEMARMQAAEATAGPFKGSRFAFVNAVINRLLDAA